MSMWNWINKLTHPDQVDETEDPSFNEEGRKHTRTTVSEEEGITVRMLANEETRSLSTPVRDLSLGGLGFQTRSEELFQEGDVVEDVTIQLPDGRAINGSLEVRHTRQNEGNQHIGGSFTDLQPEDEDTLAELVAQLSDSDTSDQ